MHSDLTKMFDFENHFSKILILLKKKNDFEGKIIVFLVNRQLIKCHKCHLLYIITIDNNCQGISMVISTNY